MKKKNNEIPIGGIGVINGYRVVAKEFTLVNDCEDCVFSSKQGYSLPCPMNKCTARKRSDKKHVYFVAVDDSLPTKYLSTVCLRQTGEERLFTAGELRAAMRSLNFDAEQIGNVVDTLSKL